NGPLAPVGGLVNGLVGDQGALTPVVGTVNNLLSGLTGGLAGGAQGGPLDPVLGLLGGLTGGQSGNGVGGLLDPVLGLVGGLTGGNGGLLGGGSAGDGVVTDVQGTVGRLVNNTALAPVGGLVNGLVDPQTGALAPVTGLVNGLTSANGPLAPVGGLVNGLVGDQGALTPVVGTVNNLLSGLTGGLTGGAQGGPLDPVLGLLGGLTGNTGTGGAGSGGLLGGLLGGGQGGGLLGGLLGGGAQGGSGNVLDLATGITLPQNQLGNTLDGVLTPLLKPVEGLVNSLLGALAPVVNPVVGVVNGVTSNLGIELPQNLHLDLVNDLSLALQGKQPLDLALLQSDGNILGLVQPAAAPTPGNPIPAPVVGEIAIGGGEINGLGTGAVATANGAGAMAIGDGAKASGALTTALGTAAAATAEATVALGGAASAAQAGATAVGSGASAAGEGSTAIGLGALATVNSSVAVGALAQATATNAVALGAGSVADEANTVSVGSVGNERRITNVANGTKLSDAATVGQLTPVIAALGGNASIALNGTVTGPTYNGFSDASQSFTDVGSALYYLDTRVTDLENSGVGGNNLVQQDAVSRDITVGKDTDGGVVNFQNKDSDARKLTGVAAGTVNATSTDAINGAQLHATNKSIADALGGNTVVNIDGSITGTTYNINEVTQGGIVNNNYTNVGDAFNSVSNSVTNLYNQVNDGKIGLVQQASPNAAITVGKSTGGNEVNFRNESGETRRLTGVSEAVEGTDAVNLDQVTRMVQGATPADLTEVRNDISSLRGDVRRVEKRADAGAATAMAVAGLPQAYLPGKSMVSMAGGVYASESGYALGASTVTENGKWVLKGSVAGSSRGQMGATIGAGYQW
ncbi:YadA-like family protein, partial [Advenella sp. WQ 585]